MTGNLVLAPASDSHLKSVSCEHNSPDSRHLDKEGIILCVDDDPTVLNALRSVLWSHFGSGLELEFAESGDEALGIFAETREQGRDVCLVITDYMMPGLHGDELLVRLHEESPDTVKVLLTGQSDLSGVKRTINEADLYRFLEKPFANEDIVLTVRGAVRAYNQERDLKRQNEALKQMNAKLESLVKARTRELHEKNRELELLSVTDRLTGLFNRRKLDQILDEELMRSRRYGTGFSLMMIDIDHFKQVNDRYGHGVGDSVLLGLARMMRERTRESDVLARYGGEEFVMVCRHSNQDGCLAAAENLRMAIAAHDFPKVGRVTTSIGTATYQEDDDADNLLRRADAALYQAKAAGRNQVASA